MISLERSLRKLTSEIMIALRPSDLTNPRCNDEDDGGDG
jgi:hypothetical protein